MMLWVTFYPSYLQYTLTEQMLNHVSVSSAKEQAVRKRDCLLWSDFVYSENSCVVFLILRMTALGNWFSGRLSAHVGRQRLSGWCYCLYDRYQWAVLPFWSCEDLREGTFCEKQIQSLLTLEEGQQVYEMSSLHHSPPVSVPFYSFLFFFIFFSFLTDRISHWAQSFRVCGQWA